MNINTKLLMQPAYMLSLAGAALILVGGLMKWISFSAGTNVFVDEVNSSLSAKMMMSLFLGLVAAALVVVATMKYTKVLLGTNIVLALVVLFLVYTASSFVTDTSSLEILGLKGTGYGVGFFLTVLGALMLAAGSVYGLMKPVTATPLAAS